MLGASPRAQTVAFALRAVQGPPVGAHARDDFEPSQLPLTTDQTYHVQQTLPTDLLCSEL